MIARRTRGRTFAHIVSDLRKYLLWWRGYLRVCEIKGALVDLDKWIRRLRYHWLYAALVRLAGQLQLTA
ncbi:group II intron maturase-specific domain-containing protein [Teredinibacter turnerae]|uniref:group II intron maturase-specific domain-containing protein n=1 Tax=Teredinibacter turnerae TaxID=2426 RepID=UPI0009B74FE5